MADPQRIGEKAEYSQFQENGLEQCPMCGRTFTGQVPYTGRVVQPTGLTEGTVYEHILETDAADGPFYCRECWDSHCTEVYSETHRTLTEFSTENETYYD